ncbi:hypothetical protein, partial [Parendozoicomonas haliclonae]
ATSGTVDLAIDRDDV